MIARTKSSSATSAFEGQGISTSIYSFQNLDELIQNTYRKLHPLISHSNSDLNASPEERELDKVNRLLPRIKTQQNINQALLFFTSSQFQIIKNRYREYFLGLFLRQSERNNPELAVFDVIQEFHRFFPHFKEEDQVELLDALSSLLLQVSSNAGSSSVPNISEYTATIKACSATLKKCIKIHFPKDLTIDYVKSILQISIKIASNLSTLSRKLSSNAVFIGEFLPFIAELEPLMKENDQELNRLIQQYLITTILFTMGSTELLSQWSDPLDKIVQFIPPLIERKPKIDFSSIKVRIQELLSIYRTQTFQRTEDVIPLFNKYLPSISPKTFQQLDFADTVYLMSIYCLELMRAERGIFGPIFDYIEVEYNPSFTAVLDAMFPSLLKTFYKYLDEITDLERRSKCVSLTMTQLILRFKSPNVRIQTRINPILTKFAYYYPSVICSEEVLQIIGQTLLSIIDQPQLQQSLDPILDILFKAALDYVPNSFIAAIFHSQVQIESSESFPSISFNHFVERFPANLRDELTRGFILKGVTAGQAKNATLETIQNIQNEEEKLLVTASYIILHPNSNLLSDVIKGHDPSILMTVWEHISMKSVELSKLITPKLIESFIDSIKTKSGIFSSTLDENMIKYQTTLLNFFVENITLGQHNADYLSLLVCGFDSQLLSKSAILPSIIAYAYLGCLVLKLPFRLSLHVRNKLQKFILRLALTAYSFIYDDTVLQYISSRELFIFESVIYILPDIFKGAKSIFENDKSLNSIDSRPNPSNVKSKGTIGRNITQALIQSEKNYQSRLTSTKTLKNFSKFVAYLLCDELQIFNSFLNPGQISPSMQRVMTSRQLKLSKLNIGTQVKLIWKILPEALYPLCRMTKIAQNVLSEVMSMMEADNITAPSVPMLSTIYAQSPKSKIGPLAVWRPIPGKKALSLLTAKMMKNEVTASYVSKCFNLFPLRESLLFLPQLVQSLRFDSCGVLSKFLQKFSKKSEVFCHYLLWNILSEKNNNVGSNDNLPKILKSLEKTIIKNMNETEKTHYENEFGLIDKLDEVSQKLLPMDIDKRPPALVDMLNELEIPEGLYIPSNPNYKIISIDADHSVPLKSHARVPILVHFKVYDENDKEKTPIPFSCIFKIMDDVRQDAMMIQFIDITKQILTDAGIDHFLFPYRVFATGTNRGVIECIHNAKSRHDLGVSTGEYLLPYFINKYGQVGTPEFQRAQDNFIKSVVPYSLICYLFQVKDRHNANIMLDEDGHVIHIDFGFIFEISPGGNLKFERSPFKLTKEMIDLMGGSKDAPAFQKFVKLLTQCFFAVRARHEELESITFLMMNAGFPCFLPDSIKKLQNRLFLDKSAKETCAEIVKLVDSAYEAKSTTLYDVFQKAQNDIFF